MPAKGRTFVRAGERRFGVYDLEGPEQREFGLLPISYDKATGEGTYLMRMSPGGETIPHEHAGYEDFLILEGDFIDDDGTVFQAGDAISYAPGSQHKSRSEKGCLILVAEWRPSRPVA